MSSRVVVIGGGLAGIAAALECAAAGAAVTLLEARHRLGGATFSVERDGLTLDNGQHVFLRCCSAYRAFLERLDVSELTSMQPRLQLPVLMPGGRRTSLAAARLPAPLHLAPSLACYRGLTAAGRIQAARAVLPLRRLDPDDASLDALTFGEWLGRHGQSRQAIDHLWNLIALPTLNLPADEASLGAAVKVFRTGLLDRADAADVGIACVPLSRLHGTAGRVALINAGVKLVFGARVSRLAGGRTWHIEWPEGEREADAVIIAVPHDQAAKLLEDAGAEPQRYGEMLGHSPIVNVHMVLDRRVMHVPFAAALDSPLQWLFDRTESSGTTAAQCLVASVSAATAWSGRRRGEITRESVTALRRLIPEARWARFEQIVVTRQPRATFRATPGTRQFRPGPATALPGVFLAGAWTATGWPDTMESAVRSGLAAAHLATPPPAKRHEIVLKEAA